MSWQTYYKEHTLTAEEAVGKIKSGDRVVLEHACGEPVYLVDKLVENAAAYRHDGNLPDASRDVVHGHVARAREHRLEGGRTARRSPRGTS